MKEPDVESLRAEVARLTERLGEVGGFDRLCADKLADEVDVLVRQHVLDPRDPAADALLDYREPPSTPRSDRLLDLEREVERLRKSEKTLARLREIYASERGGSDGCGTLEGNAAEEWDRLVRSRSSLRQEARPADLPVGVVGRGPAGVARQGLSWRCPPDVQRREHLANQVVEKTILVSLS